jgi:outer membrane protein TolC
VAALVACQPGGPRGVHAADAELALARRDVVLDAARAFFRVALAQVSVGGAADIVEGLDSLVRFNRTRVAEGVAAEGDLIRVEVERDRATTERALQEAELARARADLLPFLGDTPRTSVTLASVVVALDDSVMGAGAVLPPEGELTARALTLRPDVVAARARARAATAETGYQRALLMRQLGLTFGAKTTGGVRSMVAGLSLPIPLFDQNRGEIARAAGERTAAERELAWTGRLHLRERHEHEHTHEAIEHEHLHVHDEHHQHAHAADDPPGEPHSHPHRHEPLAHTHVHYPDIHHRHGHD